MCRFKINRTITLFCVLFIIMTAITVLWVTNISLIHVGAYHTGIVDWANMERFVSNYRALEMIKYDNSIRIWGYGSNYLSEIWVGPDAYTVYMGVHLQPVHNSLFNPLVRMGIVMGIIYLAIVSKLIDHYLTKDNLPYILPYIINAMFVHSVFEAVFLSFWMIIISTKENNNHVIDIGRSLLNKKTFRLCLTV